MSLMWVVVLRPCTRVPSLKFVGLVIRKYGAKCVSELMGLVTLTFDVLTLKLVGESHSR